MVPEGACTRRRSGFMQVSVWQDSFLSKPVSLRPRARRWKKSRARGNEASLKWERAVQWPESSLRARLFYFLQFVLLDEEDAIPAFSGKIEQPRRADFCSVYPYLYG
jgi:hypothetical protein